MWVASQTFGPTNPRYRMIDKWILDFPSHRFHLQQFLAANHSCFGIFLAYFWLLKCLSLFQDVSSASCLQGGEQCLRVGKNGSFDVSDAKAVEPILRAAQTPRLAGGKPWGNRVKVLYHVVPLNDHRRLHYMTLITLHMTLHYMTWH